MADQREYNVPTADSGLWELAAAICDDTITSAERDTLEKYLLDQPEARTFYIAYTRLHSQLLDEVGSEKIDSLRENGAEAGKSPGRSGIFRGRTKTDPQRTQSQSASRERK